MPFLSLSINLPSCGPYEVTPIPPNPSGNPSCTDSPPGLLVAQLCLSERWSLHTSKVASTLGHPWQNGWASYTDGPGTRPTHQVVHSSCSCAVQPVSLGANPTHKHTHRNFSTTMIEVCKQSTLGIHLEHLTLVNGVGIVPLGLTITFYMRPLFQNWETLLIYLLHRNKYKDLGKMRRQRNTFQMKDKPKPH